MMVRRVVDLGGAAVDAGYGTALISSFVSSSSISGLKWDGVSAKMKQVKRTRKKKQPITFCIIDAEEKKAAAESLTWNGIVDDQAFFRILIVFHIEYLDLFLFLFGRFDWFGRGQRFVALFNDDFDNWLGCFDVLRLLMLWMVWIVAESAWRLHRIGWPIVLNTILVLGRGRGGMRIVLWMMVVVMVWMVLIDLEWHRFIARRWCIIGCYSPLNGRLRRILMEIAELSLIAGIIYCDFLYFGTNFYIVCAHQGSQHMARHHNLHEIERAKPTNLEKGNFATRILNN